LVGVWAGNRLGVASEEGALEGGRSPGGPPSLLPFAELFLGYVLRILRKDRGLGVPALIPHIRGVALALGA
jgi:hypothetical protein